MRHSKKMTQLLGRLAALSTPRVYPAYASVKKQDQIMNRLLDLSKKKGAIYERSAIQA